MVKEFRCWNSHGKGDWLFWRSKKDTVAVTKTLAARISSRKSYEAFVLKDVGHNTVRPKNLAFDVPRKEAIKKAHAYIRNHDRC